MKSITKSGSLGSQTTGLVHKLGSEDFPDPGIKVGGNGKRILTVTGTFSATYKIKASQDNSTFYDLLTGITTTGAWIIEDPWLYAAVECTTYGSGSINYKFSQLVEE